MPAGAQVTAIAQGADDLPPELLGLDVRSAFYAVKPDELTFAVPVTVTRRVSLEALDLDLDSDGLPVLALALRSSVGVWEWLDSQRLTTEGGFVVASGEASHTGTVFAFGGTTFTRFGLDPDELTTVGASAILTVTLAFRDDATDPPVMGASFEPIVGSDVVTAGAGSGPDDDALSQEFMCSGVGSSLVGVQYEILNIGAENWLFRRLGLGPAATSVTASAVLDCVAPPASPTPTPVITLP